VNFHGHFYGLKIFGCKTTQLCATRCESRMDELRSVSNDVQRSENKRKNSFLNYKSAALNQLSHGGAVPIRKLFSPI
jgi:hypothetical protein